MNFIDSPRRHRLSQPLMAVTAPSGRHGDTGAVPCVAAAVGAVAAGAEQRRAAGQEAAVRPALLPVAELGGPGAAIADAQLHRGRLHAAAQVHLRPPGARRRGGVQPHRGIKGEEVHLETEDN